MTRLELYIRGTRNRDSERVAVGRYGIAELLVQLKVLAFFREVLEVVICFELLHRHNSLALLGPKVRNVSLNIHISLEL